MLNDRHFKHFLMGSLVTYVLGWSGAYQLAIQGMR